MSIVQFRRTSVDFNPFPVTLRDEIVKTSKNRNFTNMIATDMILSDSESPKKAHFEYIKIVLIFTHPLPTYR